MEDDILTKFLQIKEIFKEKFQSSTIQQQDQIYLEHLNEQLNRWKLFTNEQIKEVIEEKYEEIKQFYHQYRQEIDENYAKISEQIESNNFSSDIDQQIENFNIYCQSNTIDKRIQLNITSFTKTEIAEKIQLEYIPYSDIPPPTTYIPLKSIIKEKTQSARSSRSSSIIVPTPKEVDKKPSQYHPKQVIDKDPLILNPLTSPLKEEPFIFQSKSVTPPPSTRKKDELPKCSTRIYTGRHEIYIRVLVDKDREVSNETERITEYSIDSIQVPLDNQQQSSNVNTDSEDNETLVHAYKVLIKEQNDHQQLSKSSSFAHQNDEETTNDNIFNLQQFNQTDYSTIMFRKCETLYNCISSSTKRNELIVYNSKLKVLIILQHNDYQQCRHRFYLHWPKSLCQNISDIVYYENNDHFLISTWESSHIYLFNRDLLTLIDLGRLSDDLPLRRIHCYQQTIYCILGNNHLLEYQLDEQPSNLKFIEKIMLYNPNDRSQDTAYHLLDVTCDNNYLIVVYSDGHDEIHLQSIDRKTKGFHHHMVLDDKQPINQNYVRIESTNHNGNFIYLNGLQYSLYSIDLKNNENGKVTSRIHRNAKPTNVCFLKDGRLVILYEHKPYFLSVHDLNNRRRMK